MTDAQPHAGSRRVARNAIYNSAAWAVNVVIAIAVTPYLVRKLTVEGYGVYALLTSLIGYSSLVDLGLGQGVTKYVAEYAAQGRRDAIASSIGAALWVQVLVGGAAASALIVFTDPFLRAVNVPPALWSHARLGAYAMAAGFFFTVIAGTFSSALMGLERYDVTGRVAVVASVVLNLGVVALLHLGYGLREVVFASTLVGVLVCGVYYVLVRRALPFWRPWARLELGRFRILFQFSGFVFLSKAASVFNNYVVRFIVGAVVGPAAVAYYVVPLKIVTAVGGFFGTASSVLFPFASGLGAQKDTVRLRSAYVGAFRFIVALALPAYAIVGIYSRQVLTVWMGADFARQATGVMALLAGAYLISAATMVPVNFALGLGRSRLVAVFSVIVIVWGGLVVVPFTKWYGTTGTAAGVLLGTGQGLVFVAYVTIRLFRVPMAELLRDFLRFHLVAGSLLLAFLASVPIYVPSLSALGVIAVSACALGLYYGAYAKAHPGMLQRVTVVFRRGGGNAGTETGAQS